MAVSCARGQLGAVPNDVCSDSSIREPGMQPIYALPSLRTFTSAWLL